MFLPGILWPQTHLLVPGSFVDSRIFSVNNHAVWELSRTTSTVLNSSEDGHLCLFSDLWEKGLSLSSASNVISECFAAALYQDISLYFWFAGEFFHDGCWILSVDIMDFFKFRLLIWWNFIDFQILKQTCTLEIHPHFIVLYYSFYMLVDFSANILLWSFSSLVMMDIALQFYFFVFSLYGFDIRVLIVS